MNPGRIASHRNYGRLMAAHERDQKIRRITRIVVYFLLVAFFVILFIMVSRWGGQSTQPEPADVPTTQIVTEDHL